MNVFKYVDGKSTFIYAYKFLQRLKVDCQKVFSSESQKKRKQIKLKVWQEKKETAFDMAKQQASIEDLQSKMRNLNNEIEQIIQFCRKETLSMKYKKSFEEKESFCIKKIRLAKLCSKHTLICSKVERKILERTTTIYTILQLDIRINPKTFFKPLQFKCMYADLANETVILHYRSTNHVEGSLIITRKIFNKADYFLVYMYIDTGTS